MNEKSPRNEVEFPAEVPGAERDALLHVIAKTPTLAQDVVKATVLSGGLMNRSYRLYGADRDYVVRILATDDDLWAIDRDSEHRNSTIAAQAGIGPDVVAYLPEVPAIVVEFLNGTTLDRERLVSDDTLKQVAQALRRLHHGRPFENQFSIFDKRRHWLRKLGELRLDLPDGYMDYANACDRLEAALKLPTAELRPCHNDLAAVNCLSLSSGVIKLIDFEFSGNNDPCFDLGSIIREDTLSRKHQETLVYEYFGEVRPEKLARALLYQTMWDYGYSAAVTLRTRPGSDNGTWDPRGWIKQHFDRAAADFDDPEFEELLEVARSTNECDSER